jgi:hypothetical protein
VNVVHEFDNIETIKRAIEIGSGVALLPRPTVWQEISSGILSAVDLSDVNLVRPLGIVHKRNKQLTTAVQKFIELLQSDAAKPAAEFAPDLSQTNGHQSNGRTSVPAGRTSVVAGRRRKKSKQA